MTLFTGLCMLHQAKNSSALFVWRLKLLSFLDRWMTIIGILVGSPTMVLSSNPFRILVSRWDMLEVLPSWKDYVFHLFDSCSVLQSFVSIDEQIANIYQLIIQAKGVAEQTFRAEPQCIPTHKKKAVLDSYICWVEEAHEKQQNRSWHLQTQRGTTASTAEAAGKTWS